MGAFIERNDLIFIYHVYSSPPHNSPTPVPRVAADHLPYADMCSQNI